MEGIGTERAAALQRELARHRRKNDDLLQLVEVYRKHIEVNRGAITCLIQTRNGHVHLRRGMRWASSACNPPN